MKKIIFGILLLLISPITYAISYTLEITESELQTKVEALMPMEKKKLFVKVVLSQPEVDLSVGNNKIGVFSNIEVIAPGGIKAEGKAKFNGSLSYNAENHEFYFHNPEIISLESNSIPPKLMPKVKELAQTTASTYLAKKPVYKLNDKNLKHKLAKSVLESIEVKNNKLMVKLSAF